MPPVASFVRGVSVTGALIDVFKALCSQA